MGGRHVRFRRSSWLTEECKVINSLFSKHFPLNYNNPSKAEDLTRDLQERDGLDETFTQTLRQANMREPNRLPRITLFSAGMFMLWLLYAAVLTWMESYMPFRTALLLETPYIVSSLPSPAATLAYASYETSSEFQAANEFLETVPNQLSYDTASGSLTGQFALAVPFSLRPVTIPTAQLVMVFDKVRLHVETLLQAELVSDASPFLLGKVLSSSELGVELNPILCYKYDGATVISDVVAGRHLCTFIYASYSTIVIYFDLDGGESPPASMVQHCKDSNTATFRIDFFGSAVVNHLGLSPGTYLTLPFHVPCFPT
ncbi:MAG: uncharacterized protein KVP18_003608 [Porospora cf. gigantea A]|uniref:uncharacterized protein n=1 Tax=Porospora cf. gigantea A TaxID=2853593 RepID=UPI00355ABC2A|nr:MAG: hypothetical protein KVP18_003608 [Porospora cf. gigantea A]